MIRVFRVILFTLLLNSIVCLATNDTIRSIRMHRPITDDAYSDVSLACPEISLPSVTGNKSPFRYIDAGCETSLNIRPDFGVSGGKITGYNVYSIPYAPPFPFNMGTKIFINLDDIWGDVIQLPFKFCFFENTYSQAVVGANGLISFNTSVANMESGYTLEGKTNIPSKKFLGSSGLNWGNAIYGVFEDIDPNKISSQHTNGSIRYGLLGSYPCRTLTVSWDKVPNFSKDCISGTKYWDSFQIVLYEGTNVIDVYVNHKSRCVSWNLGRGIIGIQNKSCTKAYAAPHRNTEDSWTADREAWRFAPISSPQYTITYYSGMGINGQVLGQGEQITIDPSKVDAITARLQFTAANGDKFDIRDTAVIVRTEVQHVVTEKTICESGSYEWRGKTYTRSGIYTEGAGYSDGCYDKIYELNLNINQQKGGKEVKKLCRGESVTWKGSKYDYSGTYYFYNHFPDGCETIDTLVLTVNDKYNYSEFDTICEGDYYTWHGKTYTTTGTYYDSKQTVEGCDSIYQLQLIVGKQYLFEQKAKVCKGESYKWRGKTYKDAGIYYDSIISSLGCDSIYRLELIVAKTYRIDEYDTICHGDMYTWHNKSYFDAGIYYDSLKSCDGCDSIHVLHLHINKTYLFIEENGIRSDGTYRWRNKVLTKPGQYFDSLRTTMGCDSVYQLNLTYIRSQLYTHTKYMCEGEPPYIWRRKTYTETGVYYDSLKNVNGADSVYQLNLTIGVPLHVEETASICAGETYTWRGKTYTQADVYIESEPSTPTSCGTTYQLNLIVGQTYKNVENATFCTGSKYSWRGYEYTKPGVYYDEYKTIGGCDSVYELRLEECRRYYFPTKKTICEGDSFLWRGKYYAKSGIYSDSLKSINGCDSIYQLVLEIAKPFIQEGYVSICDNEQYYWHNHTYCNEGTYYDSLKSVYGCDSVYVLHLNVKPSYHFMEKGTICEDEIYTWRGKDYGQTDTYSEYLKTKDGCDSVYSLSLTVMPTYFRKEKGYICSGEAYEWHGKLYNEAGVYRDTLRTIFGGCDSIIELTLGVSDHYYFEEEYTTCKGAYYSWHGKEIAESGIYWDSLTTIHGCDSVFKLSISFYPTYHFITEATICSGESYAWRDSVYSIDSVYFDQFLTILDCDSLYELRLTVLPTYETQQTAYICKGDTLLWRGMKLFQEGIYRDSLQTSTSCDSVIQFELKEYPVYNNETVATINEGATYIWQDRSLFEAGVYYDSLRSVYGCDSIQILYLTVNPRYDFVMYDTICSGDSYVWQGNSYTESGTYYKTYQTTEGNDSTFELRLVVEPIYHTQSSISLCEGEMYVWRQREINNSGIYYDSLKTVFGCDSVFSIDVQVNPSYYFDIYDTICDGEMYTFGNHEYADNGKYSINYSTKHGCDSVYTLYLFKRPFPKLQIPVQDACADDEYVFLSVSPVIESNVEYRVTFEDIAKEQGFLDVSGVLFDSIITIPIPYGSRWKFVEPNVYKGIITLTSDLCQKQKDYYFSFNVLYPSYIVIQKYYDVLAVLNESHNGGYIFSDYQWYADGKPISDEKMPYFYGNGSMPAKYYQVMLTRQSDGVAMLSCPIIPDISDGIDAISNEVYVTPTSVCIESPVVYIHNTNISGFRLYSNDGVLIQYQHIDQETEVVPVRMPSVTGVFMIVMFEKSGDLKAVKIIIK